MKYSQLIGVIAAVAVIVFCFMPWSYVASIQLTLTGMHTKGTDYGRPGVTAIFFSSLSLVFFSIRAIWAKRTNLFITMLNFAWAIRNVILFSTCSMGDCPERKAGLVLYIIAAFVMMVMSFLPKIEVNNKQ